MMVLEGLAEKYRLDAKEVCQAPRLMGADRLPQDLIDLIERSERLYERVEMFFLETTVPGGRRFR